MKLTSRAIVSLSSWTLLAAVIIGLVGCDSSPSDSTTALKAKDSRRTGKYLELDDLNGFQSAESHLIEENASGEEILEKKLGLGGKARPKKFVAKRSVADGKVQEQRIARQSQQKRQQPKKQRPGFFWTLARVTFESFNDTRSAIQQIGQILNESIVPETRTTSASLKKPTTPRPVVVVNGTTTTEAPTTTTEAEFKLTRPLLQSLVRRNVKGLVRLFNIEWRDAINQSQKSVQEFQRDLGKQVGMYLQDNPNAY